MTTQEEKIKLMKNLCWDYNISPKDLLDLTEGRLTEVGGFDRTGWFVRCLEGLPWHILVPLWGGIDEVRILLTPDAIRRVWPPSRRENFERIRKILSGESVPPTGWSPEFGKELQNSFLSNRWYRLKQNLL